MPPPSNYEYEKEKILQMVKLIEGTIKHIQKIECALPEHPLLSEWDRLYKELAREVPVLKKELQRLKDESSIVFE